MIRLGDHVLYDGPLHKVAIKATAELKVEVVSPNMVCGAPCCAARLAAELKDDLRGIQDKLKETTSATVARRYKGQEVALQAVLERLEGLTCASH